MAVYPASGQDRTHCRVCRLLTCFATVTVLGPKALPAGIELRGTKLFTVLGDWRGAYGIAPHVDTSLLTVIASKEARLLTHADPENHAGNGLGPY
eukprot:2635329-Amphidinium_carterae.1